MNTLFNIVKRPIISEKSTMLGELSNTYAFEVSKDSNKQQIRDAIQKIFNVEVQSVRTMVVHGKYKRTGRFVSKRSNWKKALVKLKEGQKIEFFQGA